MKITEFNTVPNLLPENHVRRFAKEANNLLVSFRTAFKYLDKEIFSNLFTNYTRPEVELAIKFGHHT